MEKSKEVESLKTINEMCASSLCPARFIQWIDVAKDLIDTRKNLKGVKFIDDGAEIETDHVEIGDYVDAIFGVDKNGIPDSIIKAAKVIKKHFVKEDFPYAYDLEITVALDEHAGRVTTRVYNVGTGFCVKRTKEYLENEEATKYITSHLVSFGEYLLSDERINRTEGDNKLVHHADLENWSEKSKQ